MPFVICNSESLADPRECHSLNLVEGWNVIETFIQRDFDTCKQISLEIDGDSYTTKRKTMSAGCVLHSYIAA